MAESNAEKTQGARPLSYRWFAEKLSFRFVVTAAVALIVVGLVFLIGASIPSKSSFLVRLVGILGEASLSTGLTTLILVIAFNGRIEIRGAVTDAIDDRLPALADCASKSFEEIAEKITDIDRNGAPPVEILSRTRVYPRSIELLRELNKGDGCAVRILMSAEEDLAVDRTARASETGEAVRSQIGEDGKRWLEELGIWLDGGDGERELKRVIAIPRDGFGEQFDRAKQLLLKPFAERRATQWFMSDDDFSISVMLLGRRYALFGFPEKRIATGSTTPFQYAAVIQDEDLVDYLDGWFDERFVSHSDAVQVMHRGGINEDRLRAFWKRRENGEV